MVQLPQAPHIDLQLPRLLEALMGTERAQLERVRPSDDNSQIRQNWSLLRTSRRQLEGKGRTGWSPSTELSSSTGASQHINSFPGLAHLAGLELLPVKGALSPL